MGILNKQQAELFFEFIGQMVNADGSFREKRQAFKDLIDNETDSINMDEFLGWFNGELEEES